MDVCSRSAWHGHRPRLLLGPLRGVAEPMSQLNQDYVTKWVEWFLVEQDKQGLEREVRDSLEECLGMFFASQAAFELHTKNLKTKPKLIMSSHD